MPVGPTARMAVLLLRLYSITHRNSFGFGHRTKIGMFRRRYPVRPCFILLARFRPQLELDKLACAPLALDGNEKITIEGLREQGRLARNKNVAIASRNFVVIEQCVAVIPVVSIKTGVQCLLAWLGGQLERRRKLKFELECE